MNTLKELDRLNNYKDKNRHLLDQNFINDIKYGKEVNVWVGEIRGSTGLKVRYIPTIACNRKVIINKIPYYSFHKEFKISTEYLNRIKPAKDPYLVKLAQIMAGEYVIKSH